MNETSFQKKLKNRWRAYQNEISLNERRYAKPKIVEWEDLEKDSIEYIYYNDIPWFDKNTKITKNIRKKLLLRYHPDLFFHSKIGKKIHPGDREKVLEKIMDISRFLISCSVSQ
jgi:hypothetical protein